jgi:transposase
MQNRDPYPSSLTDAEWRMIEPLVPGPKLFGRPPRYKKRAILDRAFLCGAQRLRVAPVAQ